MTGFGGTRTAAEAYGALKAWFRGRGRVLVAFSGGSDSTLVLKAAVEALGPECVTAALAVSETLPSRDRERAEKTAAALGLAMKEIRTGSLEDPRFVRNPPDRCYHCRRKLSAALMAEAAAMGAESVVDGSTADDRSDYRPGARAMAEAGVRSPLAETGFTKAEVREASANAGLETAWLPSGACLASRIPYGEEVTADKLRMVDEAENFLRDLGFAQVRVRCHGRAARIETEPGSIGRFLDPGLRAAVSERLRRIGFAFSSIDLEGYRMGSLNEALGPGLERPEDGRAGNRI